MAERVDVRSGVHIRLDQHRALAIAVVRRETNSWKWPLAQFTYMTLMAYVCAFIAYRVVLFWQ